MLTTVEKIKVIMKRNNFTMTELANQLNCSRQNLSNKMSRNRWKDWIITNPASRFLRSGLVAMMNSSVQKYYIEDSVG